MANITISQVALKQKEINVFFSVWVTSALQNECLTWSFVYVPFEKKTSILKTC